MRFARNLNHPLVKPLRSSSLAYAKKDRKGLMSAR